MENETELMQMLIDVIGNVIAALSIITAIAIYMSKEKE